MQKSANDALSDALFGGFEKANAGLNNATYYFVEGVHLEMATKEFLDDMFERTLDRWTQSSSIMEVFAQSA